MSTLVYEGNGEVDKFLRKRPDPALERVMLSRFKEVVKELVADIPAGSTIPTGLDHAPDAIKPGEFYAGIWKESKER